MVSRALAGIQSTATFMEEQLGLTQIRLFVQSPLRWFDGDRKTAATVNRELLDWLSTRSQPERPFFAFLNYFDAHYPYQLPPGAFHRFGGAPVDMRQRAIIDHWGEMDKSPLTPQELAFGASAYDDCIADLDEQIGILLDKLRRRGVLEHTWLILVADHGESFGEHTGIFCHGTSLYQTELHVPLLMIPPGGRAAKQVVKDAVSLRDLAATIADVAGQEADLPFPGQSLARFWDATGAHRDRAAASADVLAEVVPNPNLIPHNRDPAGMANPTRPLGSLHNQIGHTSAARAIPGKNCSICAMTRRTTQSGRRTEGAANARPDASGAGPAHWRPPVARAISSVKDNFFHRSDRRVKGEEQTVLSASSAVKSTNPAISRGAS